ncbi:MAG: hypothetical protein ACI9C9_001705 [Marivirga sp.]|jgi:hypothetical protein
MKTIKTIKFAIVLVALFSISACELIEEPNFDEIESTGGVTEDVDNPE